MKLQLLMESSAWCNNLSFPQLFALSRAPAISLQLINKFLTYPQKRETENNNFPQLSGTRSYINIMRTHLFNDDGQRAFNGLLPSLPEKGTQQFIYLFSSFPNWQNISLLIKCCLKSILFYGIHVLLALFIFYTRHFSKKNSRKNENYEISF